MHTHISDANADSDADKDEEGDAREEVNLGEDKELIGRGGDDTVDTEGGRYGGGSEGRDGGVDIERPPRRPSP